MKPRWVGFAAAGALGAEVAAWITLFGARPSAGIDPATLAAIGGMHVFSAVLLGEAGRALATAARSTVAWRQALVGGLIPAIGTLWIVVRIFSEVFRRPPVGAEDAEDAAEHPTSDPADAPPVQSEDGVATQPLDLPVLALLLLALGQSAAALLLGWRSRPLALWSLAGFQLLLAVAATTTLAARRPRPLAGPLLLALLSLLVVGAQLLGLARADARIVALPLPPLALAGAFLLLTFPQLLLHRWLADRSGSSKDARALAVWAAGGQWLSLLGAGLLVAQHFGLTALATLGFRLLLGAAVLFACEFFLRAVGRLFASTPATAPTALLLGALVSGRNPLTALLDALERELGLSFRSSWTVAWVRRALLPLGLTLVAVLWASTALVIVEPTEQGVVYRLGRLGSAAPLGPGLHLKAPWPWDRVERRVVTRVRRIEVGYVGDASKRSLLWTSRHRKEHKLLLGSGRELVSVNAIIDYRIGDLRHYLQSFSEPRRMFQALADRVLLRRTAGRPLAGLLTHDREALSKVLERDLQGAVDQAKLGLRVLRVSLMGLHPPVEVASAYQAVVSAQLGIRTAVIQARRDAIKHVQSAQGQAKEQVLRARAAAVTRLGKGRGEARAFGALLPAYRLQPALFRLRRRLEVLEERLPGTDLFVIDPEVSTAASSLWVDLRMIDNR